MTKIILLILIGISQGSIGDDSGSYILADKSVSSDQGVDDAL